MFSKRNFLFSIAGAFLGTAVAVLTDKSIRGHGCDYDGDDDDVIERASKPIYKVGDSEETHSEG